MTNQEVKDKELYNEAVGGDEGFEPGDGYPNCEGASCDKMSDDDSADGDNASASDQLAALLAAKSAEADEWKDKYMRQSAEFDNYRKRTLREKMELIASGGEDVIKSLLPVMDDIERAVAAVEKSDDAASMREGVQLIAQKLGEALEARGATEIECKGAEFDVDLHEAVAKMPAGEEMRGRIIDVVQKGYRFKDKVIRYAKVVVGE